nr:hypothetical protein CFP56_46829 [Quercus suber]POE87652.1 hypothetical protein CFP56_30241 [Quercus suber]
MALRDLQTVSLHLHPSVSCCCTRSVRAKFKPSPLLGTPTYTHRIVSLQHCRSAGRLAIVSKFHCLVPQAVILRGRNRFHYRNLPIRIGVIILFWEAGDGIAVAKT